MEKKELDTEKLGKIIALATRGEGGEKENAIRIVKRICKENDLNYDDVMNGVEKREYQIECKLSETTLLSTIIYRYAFLSCDDTIGQNHNATRLFFKTTADKFIETKNAFDILRIKFKEEKSLIESAFLEAFRAKHHLHYTPTEKEWEKINKKAIEEADKKKTKKELKEEIKKREMAIGMVRALDDVSIHKQLN
jgi:hypothetical protein